MPAPALDHIFEFDWPTMGSWCGSPLVILAFARLATASFEGLQVYKDCVATQCTSLCACPPLSRRARATVPRNRASAQVLMRGVRRRGAQVRHWAGEPRHAPHGNRRPRFARLAVRAARAHLSAGDALRDGARARAPRSTCPRGPGEVHKRQRARAACPQLVQPTPAFVSAPPAHSRMPTRAASRCAEQGAARRRAHWYAADRARLAHRADRPVRSTAHQGAAKACETCVRAHLREMHVAAPARSRARAHRAAGCMATHFEAAFLRNSVA